MRYYKKNSQGKLSLKIPEILYTPWTDASCFVIFASNTKVEKRFLPRYHLVVQNNMVQTTLPLLLFPLDKNARMQVFTDPHSPL